MKYHLQEPVAAAISHGTERERENLYAQHPAIKYTKISMRYTSIYIVGLRTQREPQGTSKLSDLLLEKSCP